MPAWRTGSGHDAGQGDHDVQYVRDEEKREVDLLVTERCRPALLVEAKLTDEGVSPSLRYVAERLAPPWAIEVVRRGAPRVAGDVRVVPAARFLALI